MKTAETQNVNKTETVDREIFNTLMENYNSFIRSAVCSLWDAFKETINKPFRKLTPAERKIDSAFRRYIISICVSENSITYKTIAGDFSSIYYLEEV